MGSFTHIGLSELRAGFFAVTNNNDENNELILHLDECHLDTQALNMATINPIL